MLHGVSEFLHKNKREAKFLNAKNKTTQKVWGDEDSNPRPKDSQITRWPLRWPLHLFIKLHPLIYNIKMLLNSKKGTNHLLLQPHDQQQNQKRNILISQLKMESECIFWNKISEGFRKCHLILLTLKE